VAEPVEFDEPRVRHPFGDGTADRRSEILVLAAPDEQRGLVDVRGFLAEQILGSDADQSEAVLEQRRETLRAPRRLEFGEIRVQ